MLEHLEEARDIAVQPGAVWEPPEQACAYLLDLLQGGGVRLHVDYADLVYRTLHDLSEIPRVAFGDGGCDRSSVALQLELDPLLRRVARKRLTRTGALRRRDAATPRRADLERDRPSQRAEFRRRAQRYQLGAGVFS